mgnify:CR=1 FL=1
MRKSIEWIGSRVTVKRGDVVHCNRCEAAGTWPKDETTATANNDNAYRIEQMAFLDCGHMDSHWLYLSDNPGKEVMH